VSLDTTREDLVRAMIEGTAHNVAWLLPEVERFTGQAVTELGFFGGAARAPGWGQVLADVLGRPVSTLADPETAVAAAVARRAQGHPIDAAPAVREVHHPDPVAHEALQGAHEQFREVHAALRPLHHALNG
jgi:xylulokinase